MKRSINITSSVNLDEIKYQLQENLSIEGLVNFCIELGEDLSDSNEFYYKLKNILTKIETS